MKSACPLSVGIIHYTKVFFNPELETGYTSIMTNIMTIIMEWSDGFKHPSQDFFPTDIKIANLWWRKPKFPKKKPTDLWQVS